MNPKDNIAVIIPAAAAKTLARSTEIMAVIASIIGCLLYTSDAADE